MTKTVLELFREKVFQSNDISEVEVGNEIDNDIKLRRLEDVCNQYLRDTPYLLNTRGRKLLNLIRKITDYTVIKIWLHQEVTQLPPLELLCFLHTSGVMQVTTFLYYKAEYCDEISSQLVEMITCNYIKEEAAVVRNIVTLFLSSMINVGSHSLRQLYTVTSKLMESFTTTLISELFNSNKNLELDFLSVIVEKKCVFDEGLKSFATFLLNSLLTHDWDVIDFKTALGKHHKEWTSDHIPHKFISLYNQLETLLSKEGVMTEVEHILDDGQVNIKHLLYVISLMTLHCQNTPDTLDVVKVKADKWFKEALNERNEPRFGLALLVTRHHFTQISKYLVNYANWFGSIQSKNVLTHNFFFEFLSKIVPFEPAVFLKIQVTKVPTGSSACQDTISDYISLAKTRLVDMNQTYDYISLFNDYHDTIEEQQESDVKRVVAYFADCGEVNKAVLEASVFRKQYYEKVFLPCLLSVSRGTDPSRDQLIIKLNTLGKMPSGMYRNWSKSR